jgi:hydrogenase expression/formation protein HypC
MRLVEVRSDGKGVAELEGSRHVVDLSLVSGAQVGVYVIIHAGFAIETLDQEAADATLALFSEIVDLSRSDSLSPASDLRPPTSDLRPPTSDLRPPTSDL